MAKNTGMGKSRVPVSGSDGMDEIQGLRDEIDELDSQMFDIVRARLALAEEIGKIKKERRMRIEDAAREREVLERMRALAGKKHLDAGFVESMMKVIFDEAKRLEKEID